MVAIAMTLVATVALGSSTYAWFAINSKVEATGMTFKTQVSDNLFIAADTLANTGAVDEKLFGTSLVQNVNGILEPVSTINALDNGFYYASTTNVKGDGDTKTNSWISYAPGEDFETNYGATGAVGYVDYVYRLKATNGSSEATDLTLTELTLNYYKGYNQQDVVPSNAFRAAVFVDNITSNTYTQDTAVNVAKADYNNGTEDVTVASIYRATGSQNFSQIDGTQETENEGEKTIIRAVADTTTLKDVSYKNDATVIRVPANSTQYYKVVVRVWLEGEDTTCNNATFVKLDDGAWSLDCGWVLGDLDAANAVAVTSLTVEATAADATNVKVEVNKGTTGTATQIAGSTYYKIDGKSVAYFGEERDLYANEATVSENTKFYVIVVDDAQNVAVDITELITINPAAQP